MNQRHVQAAVVWIASGLYLLASLEVPLWGFGRGEAGRWVFVGGKEILDIHFSICAGMLVTGALVFFNRVETSYISLVVSIAWLVAIGMGVHGLWGQDGLVVVPLYSIIPLGLLITSAQLTRDRQSPADR